MRVGFKKKTVHNQQQEQVVGEHFAAEPYTA